MVRVFSLLPARPLRGRPPGSVSGITASAFVVWIFGSLLFFPAVLAPPALLTDWQVRGAALYLRDGTVRSDSCTSSDFFELCDMTLSAPVGAGQVERRVSYVFLSASEGRRYRVVADPAHPQWLATDVGLDLFWNRLACSAGAALVLGLLAWILGLAGVRNFRRRRAWRKRDAVAVKLRLLSRQTLRGRQLWTVQGDAGPPELWAVPRKAAPFLLGSASEVLGLQRLDGTAVMPLDSRLRWVNLTEAERALVLGAAKR